MRKLCLELRPRQAPSLGTEIERLLDKIRCWIAAVPCQHRDAFRSYPRDVQEIDQSLQVKKMRFVILLGRAATVDGKDKQTRDIRLRRWRRAPRRCPRRRGRVGA